MKKELDALSKETLEKIAKKYNIYNPEIMSKEELINQILISSGHDKKIKTVKKDIKVKKSFRNILYNIMFISLILISVITTIYNLVNRIYFQPKLTRSSLNGNEIYGIFLTLASAAFSFYVYYSWMKTGVIHIYLLFGVIMSIGWFIYIAYSHYKFIIKPYLEYPSAFRSIYKSFFVFYWFNISVVSALALTSGMCFILRK